jgi:sec-independent protein translocase protein TatC
MNKNYIVFNHLLELKYRFYYTVLSFIFSFLTLYFYLGETLYIIIKPLLMIENIEVNHLIYTNMAEVFFATLKLSFSLSCYSILFIMLYQVYYFILPGIFKHEQKKFRRILSIIMILLVLSFIFTYNFFVPYVWSFFLQYDVNLNDELFKLSFEGKIIEYINLITNILFTFFICFQLPIVFGFCLKLEILSAKKLEIFRSFAIVLCFIIGALCSPPDVISQISLAIPLCLTYELSIFYGSFLSNKLKLLRNY